MYLILTTLLRIAYSFDRREIEAQRSEYEYTFRGLA